MVYKMCHYKSRDRVIVDLSGAGVFYSRDSVKHREAQWIGKGVQEGPQLLTELKLKTFMPFILIRITKMHWTQMGNQKCLYSLSAPKSVLKKAPSNNMYLLATLLDLKHMNSRKKSISKLTFSECSVLKVILGQIIDLFDAAFSTN